MKKGGHYITAADVQTLVDIWDMLDARDQYSWSDAERKFHKWVSEYAQRLLRQKERRDDWGNTHGNS